MQTLEVRLRHDMHLWCCAQTLYHAGLRGQAGSDTMAIQPIHKHLADPIEAVLLFKSPDPSRVRFICRACTIQPILFRHPYLGITCQKIVSAFISSNWLDMYVSVLGRCVSYILSSDLDQENRGASLARCCCQRDLQIRRFASNCGKAWAITITRSINMSDVRKKF